MKQIKLFTAPRMDCEKLEEKVNEFLRAHRTDHWEVDVKTELNDGKILVTIVYS